jgi:hypothetical protein
VHSPYHLFLLGASYLLLSFDLFHLFFAVLEAITLRVFSTAIIQAFLACSQRPISF